MGEKGRETIVWNFIVFYAGAIQINFYLRYMFISAQEYAECAVLCMRSGRFAYDWLRVLCIVLLLFAESEREEERRKRGNEKERSE